MTFEEIKNYLLLEKGLEWDGRWSQFMYGKLIFAAAKRSYKITEYYALDFVKTFLYQDGPTKLLTQISCEVKPEWRYELKNITKELLDQKYKEYIERLDFLAKYSKREKIIQKENELRRDF